MPITVVATTKFTAPSGGTSPSFDSTGADLLLVFVAFGITAPTISDSKGNTWTATGTGGGPAGRWYYCYGPTVGAGHTVTLGGGSIGASAIVYALAGTLQTSGLTYPGATDITTDPWTFRVAVTPTVDGCFVAFGALLNTSPALSSVTPGSGWSVPQSQSGSSGSYYGSVIAHQIQTTARTVGASETLGTLNGYGTGGSTLGLVIKPATGGGGGGLTLTTPVPYEVHQRSGTTGSIQISGTVSGATEDIEASFNGGPFATIATAVPAGSFTGTLTGQAQGQGTLTVRKKTTTTTSATVANVGIGDVFLDFGDSRSNGRGTNGQAYSHATLKAAQFKSGAWSELTESAGAGTHVPLLATQIMASQNVPVAFIRTGVGSTDVAGAVGSWAKPGTEYTAAVAAVTSSTVSGIKGCLGLLGPNAIVNNPTLTLAAYRSALDTLAANFAADLPGAPKLFVDICGEVSTGSPPDRRLGQDNIRGGVLLAWNNNSTAIKPGPVLVDQTYADGVHPLTDTAFQQVAQRYWASISEALYGGAAGRGPRVTSAMWNAGRTQITVSFSRALKTGLTHATQPWTIKDNGTTMTVSSVAYHGTNPAALVITTSAAASGPAGTTTLSFASGDDAIGRVVPLSTDVALPAGGVTNLPAEPIYAFAASELDLTPPTLTSPTGTATGSTTASGTVSTSEAGGTLYRLASTSSTATASEVKAGLSSTVTSSGTQSVSFTGLTASTTYYAHYLHTDAAGNDSTVVSSGAFTTTAAAPPPIGGSGVGRIALTQSGQLVVLLP